MRYRLILMILFLVVPCYGYGQDMRAVSQKARADYEAARAEARASEKLILKDRQSLKKEIARLTSEVKTLENTITIMQNRFNKLRKKGDELAKQKSEDEMEMRELAGTGRVVARDLEAILRQSHFTAGLSERLKSLKPILKKNRFPGMDDFRTTTDLFFEEMALSGEVNLLKGFFVDCSGVDQKGDILTIGKFTAAYKTKKEIGFLKFSEASHRLYALSSLPSWKIRRNLNKYMEGKTDDVYLDLSGGAALRQVTHKSTLKDQIGKGGPIVWPILGIGLVALFLVLEKTLFLKRVHARTDLIMGKVNKLASQKKWEECRKLLQKDKRKGPVHNVLMTGLSSRNEDREVLESVLQESILKELPRLERFLPTLNILGAIAPLLGLLGTVTGMISTFHVITLYGTGDPRMMSGGISEALVTTELGLAVAIPIMLIHTFLSRRVDHVIGDMEEKAVTLTNIIRKQRV